MPTKLCEIAHQLNYQSLLTIKESLLKLAWELGSNGIDVEWDMNSIGLTKNF